MNQSLAVQQRNFRKNHFIVSAMNNSLTVASCLDPTSLFCLLYFSHNLSLMSLLLTSCLIVMELHFSPPLLPRSLVSDSKQDRARLWASVSPSDKKVQFAGGWLAFQTNSHSYNRNPLLSDYISQAVFVAFRLLLPPLSPLRKSVPIYPCRRRRGKCVVFLGGDQKNFVLFRVFLFLF